MQWTGEGLIVGVRRHGETSTIVEAMVAGRGRHLGLVRGGRSRKLAPTLQPGNTVQLTWRARLEDHLGMYTVELLDPRAARLIEDRVRLYALQLVCDHLRILPERDPHDRLLGMVVETLDAMPDDPALAAALARFELALLEDLGFGLDLQACAVTGARKDLTHVSPRSGRAVSRAAAEPYIDRLLTLPAFLTDADKPPQPGDLAAAFRLTGHFLNEHVWLARNIAVPSVRDRLIETLTSL